jgi:hypothetical protein
MKKLCIVLVAALLPSLAFADFQLGATAFYQGDIGSVSLSDVSAADFLYGVEARATLWIFQVGINALYATAGNGLFSLADAGVAFDILFLRLGLGIGPTFAGPLGEGDGIAPWGMNVKVGLDVNIGNLAVGMSAYYLVRDISEVQPVFERPPYVALNLLFRVF